MSYEGPERRVSEADFKLQIIRKLDAIEADGRARGVQIDELSKRVEHSNANTKAFKVVIDEDIQSLRTSIQGDESKGVVGMASRIKTLVDEFAKHCTADAWGFGIMISLMVTVLGWTVFHAH